jgi:DNA replication protein DnaC
MRSNPLSLQVDDLERRFGVVAKQLAKCEEHGEYASIVSRHSDKPSGCPVCAEILQREKDQAEQMAMHTKNATAALQRKLGSAMVPKRFAGKTFEQYNAVLAGQKRNLSKCKAYADNFAEHSEAGRCLLLLGKPGTGKTHLAAAIAWQVMQCTAATVVYRTVGGILQYIKGSYDSSAEYTEAEAYASLVKPALLIIDEVGATKPTEFEQATLFAIINGRYEEQRPTVVVSNLMPEELPAVLGERSVDRLREGGGIGLVFDWESARSGVTA